MMRLPWFVAAEAAAIEGIGRVLAVDAEHLAAPLAANWAAEAVALAGDYTHLLGPSTTLGRDLMPRVAALLGVNQVSDIMEVTAPNSFKRPIYAGNAIVDVTVPDGLKVVATARTASWKTAPGGGSAAVETVAAANAAVDHTRFVGMEIEGSERPDEYVIVCGHLDLGDDGHHRLLDPHLPEVVQQVLLQGVSDGPLRVGAVPLFAAFIITRNASSGI